MAIRVGVVGAGYWGPNLIRNFHQQADVELATVADLDEGRRKYVAEHYPEAKVVEDFQEIIRDDSIDAVAVATPASTHFEIGSAVLEAGKHCYVEKPLTRTVAEAQGLMDKAEAAGKILMVGHTFLYTAAVRRIKEMVDAGDLGKLLYLRTMRVNLGLFQNDINVIWDLAPHDLSILLHIIGKPPRAVSATGKCHVGKTEDVASVALEFDDELIAYVFNSWLDPHKQRYFTVVGDKKMLVYDDVEPQEKLRIYDRGVEAPPYYDTYGDFAFSYRYGDIVTPMLESTEPLRALVRHFVDCCASGETPISSGKDGYEVVRILEACDRSLEQKGARIELDW